MNEGLIQFGLTAFITLTVVVDPFGIVPIFVSLTTGMPPIRRQTILTRAVLISLGISLFFLFAGRSAITYLGVSVPAFAISGGILLFVTALPMLFGQRPGLQSSEPHEHGGDDVGIAIFPLAIPLLAGPGTITTLLLLSARAGGEPWRMGVLVLTVAAVFAATWIILRVGEPLVIRIGEGGVHIFTRVMGILLAALAVQFILNGIAEFFDTLAPPTP